MNYTAHKTYMINIKEGLNAISPIDGRYSHITYELKQYFSESALIKYRIMIEIYYLKTLLPFVGYNCTVEDTIKIHDIYEHWSMIDSIEVKNIEQTTNHDVKAVEIFIRNKLDDKSLGLYKEMVHFGLTSQDINSTANILSIRDTNVNIVIPLIIQFIDTLTEKSAAWNISMLSKTHGQCATPTTLKKEMNVFVYRLRRQFETLETYKYRSKFGGAVGNLNSHYIAFSDKDWVTFADTFLQQFNLIRNTCTTQIDNYDNYSEIFDNLKRICVILLDFSRDMWLYISYDYFQQLCVEKEVGSSTMPHKINPIHFENAEGNLLIAIELLNFVSKKLPVSRLQRDLTDSTVLRNIGTIYGHIIISIKSLLNGINRVEPNTEYIKHDLINNNIVIAEAIQSILRRENVPDSYDIIKYISRGNKIFDMKIVIVQLRERLVELSIESIRIDNIISEIIGLNVQTYTGNTDENSK